MKYTIIRKLKHEVAEERWHTNLFEHHPLLWHIKTVAHKGWHLASIRFGFPAWTDAIAGEALRPPPQPPSNAWGKPRTHLPPGSDAGVIASYCIRLLILHGLLADDATCSVSIPFNRDSIASRAQLWLWRFLRAKVVWRAQHRRPHLVWAEVSGRTLLWHSACSGTWETQGGFLVKSEEWRIIGRVGLQLSQEWVYSILQQCTVTGTLEVAVIPLTHWSIMQLGIRSKIKTC